jgi:ADP-ribose pyrophosphatase YjhB (NUDIX family)
VSVPIAVTIEAMSRGSSDASKRGRPAAQSPEGTPQTAQPAQKPQKAEKAENAQTAPSADASVSAGTTASKAPGRKRSSKSATTKSGTAKSGTAKSSATKSTRTRTARKSGAQKAADKPARRRPWLQRVDETSAGGLVVDLDGEVPRGALIGRIDKRGRLLWSLPKGHVEPGETHEQAAVREVAEETGISGEILATLGTIDFWFIADGRRVHKTVHHYLLRAVGGELSDADIEVSEVAWVPLGLIAERLAYPDERGLVDTAGRLLAESA